jgi:hypothetical protein
MYINLGGPIQCVGAYKAEKETGGYLYSRYEVDRVQWRAFTRELVN